MRVEFRFQMDALEASLEMHALQLEQVKLALRSDPANEDLLQLKADLEQLISLTNENVLEEKKKELLNEVNSLEEGKNEETMRKDLEDKLLGLQCRVPHIAAYSGQTSVADAIVFQLESYSDNSVKVRVVFSHPTSQDMLPCQHFLRGKCKFGEEKCKFSHGEVKQLDDLLEYQEPDFGAIKATSHVLAKAEGEDLWAKAVVEHVEGEIVHVKFARGGNQIHSLNIQSVHPLPEEEESDDDQEEEEPMAGHSKDTNFEESETNFAPIDLLGSLESEQLGEWEKHTKGFGSKLMARMGYVAGAGLGKNSDGRVLPVLATVYPQGKSLDSCMEARLKGHSSSVEKTLKRQRMREEKKSLARLKADEAKKRRENKLFDLINHSIADHSGQRVNLADLAKERTLVKKKVDGKEPSKDESLNVKAFKLSEEIRRAEKDLQRLEASAARHRHDKATAAGMRARVQEAHRRVAHLKAKERGLEGVKAKQEGRGKVEIF